MQQSRFLGDAQRQCNKTTKCAAEYQSRISGPFFDRIDIYIEVNSSSINEIINSPEAEDSTTVALRVQVARDIQVKRYLNTGIKDNSQLSNKLIKEFASPNIEGQQLLDSAAEKMRLSMRGYNRVLKLSRSIADLAGEEIINKMHIGEALNYRRLNYNLRT